MTILSPRSYHDLSERGYRAPVSGIDWPFLSFYSPVFILSTWPVLALFSSIWRSFPPPVRVAGSLDPRLIPGSALCLPSHLQLVQRSSRRRPCGASPSPVKRFMTLVLLSFPPVCFCSVRPPSVPNSVRRSVVPLAPPLTGRAAGFPLKF